MYFAIFVIMKTCLFLLSALIILAVSCKKETPVPPTTALFEHRITYLDSCTKPFWYGKRIKEDVRPWVGFASSTEEMEKDYVTRYTIPWYISDSTNHDSVHYKRTTAEYRRKP